jgi:5-methylcytosine-specific restriction endonuclease McrA
VVRRDGGRCTFVDRNGERCTETIALQIDHVRPRALGGSDEPTNLRAMCAAHNRLLAERTFGRKTVERAIRSARPDP